MAVVLGLTACSSGSRIQGLITGIDRSDGRVDAITVLSSDGPQRIFIDAERNYGFDLAHLQEHKTEGLPVNVKVKDRDGRKVALEIDDA